MLVLARLRVERRGSHQLHKRQRLVHALPSGHILCGGRLRAGAGVQLHTRLRVDGARQYLMHGHHGHVRAVLAT